MKTRAMRLISAILSVAGLCGCAAWDRGDARGSERPNIILIMADDIGVECFPSYGGESYAMPRLDRLAAGGVRFTACHALPLCTPTRVQLMTGQSNIRNYVRFGIMDPAERTFGHMLQQAGYATAIAGKWQLYGNDGDGPHAATGMHPRGAGFDEYCLWQIDRRESRYWDPLVERNGTVFETAGRYGPDIFADFVCDFAARHRDRPFFIYYPMVLTHSPFEPTPDSGDSLADEPADARGRMRDPRYFGDMVAYMDKIVGRIDDHLESLGLRENTVLIFTSDNGTQSNVVSRRNGREARGGKGSTTDAGTHVPLIVSWPRRSPVGTVCEDLIDSTDFLPTLASLAGARPPADRVIDGRSFAPQILGQRGRPRPWLFSYYNPLQGPRSIERRWARDHRWKLYATGELYDVLDDSLEKRPVADDRADRQARAARRKLQAAIDSMPSQAAKLRNAG